MTTTASRSVRIEGVATLLSSLSHGGEHAGTTSFLRREKILGADGAPRDVPIVSGNAVRGLLRDHAAEVFWTALGRPELPPQVFHLLWSGGSLSKAGASHTIGARQLQEVRRLVPLVSLFGGSGASKIIEGKLRVGKMTPVCGETAHLLPPDLPAGQVRSIWELLQIEEFTRRDDSKRDQFHVAITGLAPRAVDSAPEAGALLAVAEHKPATEDSEDPAQQMRYGVETLAAGTRLHWWMALRQVTDVEASLFAAAMESWSAAGAAIGGRSATGHGRLRLDVHQWRHAAPTLTIGQALAVSGPSDLDAHVAAHRAAILDALGWFA
ncbi:MAG: hypothetical protein ACRD0V_18715 [Acidimicrobiales bacterium]